MMEKKKVAVILSGCGAKDGSEIREAIFLLLSLAQNNIRYECFSVNKEQAIVFDHYHDKIAKGETRNVLVESARIARGNVKDIKTLNPAEFAGIAFAGGYGAGLNLSDFAIKNSHDFETEKDIEKAIMAFYKADKPLLFLCVSSLLVSKLIENVKITLGGKNEISEKVREAGVNVVETHHNTPIIDEKHKVISAPCYMLEINIVELYNGIFSAAKEFAKML